MGRILTQSVRTTQPQSLEETGFNRQNYFGAACLWSCIPALGNAQGTAGTYHGNAMATMDSHPRTRLIPALSSGTGLLARRLNRGGPPPGGEGDVSMLFNNGAKLVSEDFLKPHFPDPRSVCAVAIIRPEGTGRAANDPRILTICEGTAEADHDLMIGLAFTTGEAKIRSRVRCGGSVRTALGSSGQVLQQDKWNVLSGGCETRFSAQPETFVQVLHEDGTVYRNNNTSPNTDDEWVSTTGPKIAIGASAIVGTHPFDGQILIVYYFDGRYMDSASTTGHAHKMALLRANPWQVFEPETVPSFYPSAATTERKTIWVPR